MKKSILFLMMLSSLNMLSQEIVKTKDGKSVQLNADNTWKYINVPWSFLYEKDFTNSNGLLRTVFNTKVNVWDGKKNDVPCSFSLSISDPDSPFKEFKDLNMSKIATMVIEINSSAMYSVKNKSTYLPSEISLFYMDNKWFAECYYTAQNDFGATKDGKETMFFFSDGKKMTDEELIKSQKKANQ